MELTSFSSKVNSRLCNARADIRLVTFNSYLPRMFFSFDNLRGSSEDPKFTCPILLTDSSCAVDFLICRKKFILV